MVKYTFPHIGDLHIFRCFVIVFAPVFVADIKMLTKLATLAISHLTAIRKHTAGSSVVTTVELPMSLQLGKQRRWAVTKHRQR